LRGKNALAFLSDNMGEHLNKKTQLTQGLRPTTPSFQDGRQPPSWILSNRK